MADLVDDAIGAMLKQESAGAGDGLKLQLEMMREKAAADERRQEREAQGRREWMQALLAAAAPVIAQLFTRAPDPLSHPLIAKLIEGAGGGEQTKKIQDAMASSLRESSKLQVETMMAAMQSASAMKDQLNEKMMESALERIERLRDEDDGDRGPLSGASDLLELIKGAKELLNTPAASTPAPPAIPGPGSRRDDQVDDDEAAAAIVDAQDAAAAANPPARRRLDPLELTMRGIYGYYRGEIPEAERPAFLQRLVAVAGRAPAFKAAIVAGDEAAVLELVAPVMTANPALAAWVQEAGALDWLRRFAAEVLKPALSAPPRRPSTAPVRRVAARAAAAPRARRHVVLADDPLV